MQTLILNGFGSPVASVIIGSNSQSKFSSHQYFVNVKQLKYLSMVIERLPTVNRSVENSMHVTLY